MGSAIKVLCVDDNALVAEAIEMKLTRVEGFEWIGHLPDAERLLACAQESQPDIVLLDIDLPGRDAFDVLNDLSEACPEVRVIMFSGLMRSDLVNRAIDAGAWGYLTKSIEFQELTQALRRVAAGEFAMSSDVSAGAPWTGPM